MITTIMTNNTTTAETDNILTNSGISSHTINTLKTINSQWKRRIYRRRQSNRSKTRLRICPVFRHSNQQLPHHSPISHHNNNRCNSKCKLNLSKHQAAPRQCSIPHKLIIREWILKTTNSQVPHSMAQTFTKRTPSLPSLNRRQAWSKPSKTTPSKCLRSSGVLLRCSKTRPPHSSFLRVQTPLNHLQQAS